MSTQRQFDLCMGPDAKETDCTQNTLHFYVKFIRRDRHIYKWQALKICDRRSLARFSADCSGTACIHKSERLLVFLLFWESWTLFNLKNSFPVLLFQSKNWTVSKIRKLNSSKSNLENFSTDKKALVWLNSEPKARVGQISLRGFSENGVKFLLLMNLSLTFFL